MSVEYSKQAIYFQLVKKAEKWMLWQGVDEDLEYRSRQALDQALAASILSGLTTAEIQAALVIGCYWGEAAAIADEHANHRTPEYWQKVRQEAETFWLKRYRGEDY